MQIDQQFTSSFAIALQTERKQISRAGNVAGRLSSVAAGHSHQMPKMASGLYVVDGTEKQIIFLSSFLFFIFTVPLGITLPLCAAIFLFIAFGGLSVDAKKQRC